MPLNVGASPHAAPGAARSIREHRPRHAALPSRGGRRGRGPLKEPGAPVPAPQVLPPVLPPGGSPPPGRAAAGSAPAWGAAKKPESGGALGVCLNRLPVSRQRRPPTHAGSGVSPCPRRAPAQGAAVAALCHGEGAGSRAPWPGLGGGAQPAGAARHPRGGGGPCERARGPRLGLPKPSRGERGGRGRAWSPPRRVGAAVSRGVASVLRALGTRQPFGSARGGEG